MTLIFIKVKSFGLFVQVKGLLYEMESLEEQSLGYADDCSVCWESLKKVLEKKEAKP
jgi:bacterioferritin-associated ferredoxin